MFYLYGQCAHKSNKYSLFITVWHLYIQEAITQLAKSKELMQKAYDKLVAFER